MNWKESAMERWVLRIMAIAPTVAKLPFLRESSKINRFLKIAFRAAMMHWFWLHWHIVILLSRTSYSSRSSCKNSRIKLQKTNRLFVRSRRQISLWIWWIIRICACFRTRKIWRSTTCEVGKIVNSFNLPSSFQQWSKSCSSLPVQSSTCQVAFCSAPPDGPMSSRQRPIQPNIDRSGHFP